MEVIDRIRTQLAAQPIVLYMKGSPERPMCEGSRIAVDALRGCGVPFLAVDIQKDPELRAYLPKYSDLPGFPQFFLQGEFIGGADVLADLMAQGELPRMVASCQLPRASNA